MKKVVLIDGNNLMFRSYYATMYSGASMKSNDQTPTNALYGFMNMLNKIITEECPEYLIVAFDKGKTFRHETYQDYKGGRNETPNDLKVQFPIAKEILSLRGITYLEIDNYEADDIIGTICHMIDEKEDYVGKIISSDRDLLQLVSKKNKMKLLKSSGFIDVTNENFEEIFQLKPSNIIDLKGLVGDASDNIPGVKGVGEKTALKLINEYHSIENVYANIDNIKGSLHEKLVSDKTSAFFSKSLATIFTEVPLDINLEDLKYTDVMSDELLKKYQELNFSSFIKNIKPVSTTCEKYILVNSKEEFKVVGNYSLYVELDNSNYHLANIISFSAYDGINYYYIPYEVFQKYPDIFNIYQIITYDLKRLYCTMLKENVEINNVCDDIMLLLSLNGYNLKDDISYVAYNLGYNVLENKKVSSDDLVNNSLAKVKFIYEMLEKLKEDINNNGQAKLYEELEMPLSIVLGDMEQQGVYVDKKVLNELETEFRSVLLELENSIYTLALEKFNINSPKQLAIILFEKLGIIYPKKNAKTYSTDIEILQKIRDKHEIVDLLIKYRMINKLLSTYVVGLNNYITVDSKIHTIYTQTLTRTGRLSSIEPNLQNIPTKNDIGKQIRKAFVPHNGIFISADYSQIELRMLAHLSEVKDLIEAFNSHNDIHTATAMKIFKVSSTDVTKEMRRKAKVINFGILYGMSSYGLASELHISTTEANDFIESYYQAFPGIKEYMNSLISKASMSGSATTIMGRVRKIDELSNPNYMIREQGKRIALNTPIQGSSADIMKKAMIDVSNRFKSLNLKSKLIMQVHDELIVDTFLDEEDIVKKELKQAMEEVYPMLVKLETSMDTGMTWYDVK